MNWEHVKLGSLVELITKGTTPTSVGYNFTDSGINFIKIESIDLLGNFLPHKFAKINLECHQSLKRSQLKKGDILFSIAGALGRTAIVTDNILPANTNQALAIIRLENQKTISKEFLLRVLSSRSVINQISKMKGGVAQQNLSLSQLKDFLVPLPPIEIQKKIVLKLDAIFAEIDKAIRVSETNAMNAEALLQSYINELLESDEEDWVTHTFDDIVLEKQIGLVRNAKEQDEDAEYAYFKMNNITNDNKCSLTMLTKVNASTDELKKFKLNKNDFLFNTRNSVELVGKACVFDGETSDNILYNNNIMRVRFKPNINPNFILFSFSNKKVKDRIEKLKTGATNVAAIYYKDLKDLKIQIPNLQKQNSLIKKLNEVSSYTNLLLTKSKERTSNYRLLKQSVLQKAFNGELIKE